MWSPDRLPAFARLRRPAAALGLSAALLLPAACTVQPLYASRGFTDASQAATQAPDSGALPPLALAPVATREGQEVRNQLLFLLNGGGRQPENPRYTVSMTVAAVEQSSATIQVQRDEEPTAAQMAVSASYVITDTQTAVPVAQGRREILSAFDVPRQEFAVSRARRDAQNRAARELAALLRLAIVQDLLKVKDNPPPTPPPAPEIATANAVSGSSAPAAPAPLVIPKP